MGRGGGGEGRRGWGGVGEGRRWTCTSHVRAYFFLLSASLINMFMQLSHYMYMYMYMDVHVCIYTDFDISGVRSEQLPDQQQTKVGLQVALVNLHNVQYMHTTHTCNTKRPTDAESAEVKNHYTCTVCRIIDI